MSGKLLLSAVRDAPILTAAIRRSRENFQSLANLPRRKLETSAEPTNIAQVFWKA